MRRLAFVALLLTQLGCVGPKDQCEPKAARCVGTGAAAEAQSCVKDCTEFGCAYRWKTLATCGSRTCIDVAGAGALCVTSTAQDPACAQDARAHCDGDALVTCSAGYSVERPACGSGDAFGGYLPGGPAATHCVPSSRDGATCVPAASALDPLCGTDDAPYCTPEHALVECAAGHAVFRSSCLRCQAGGAPAECAGFLGAPCSSDTACAAGLTCHTGLDGVRSCSAPCTVTVAGDDCLDRLGTEGLPLSTYAEIGPPGGQLACIAGFCTWQH